jgi:hypothetical protein
MNIHFVRFSFFVEACDKPILYCLSLEYSWDQFEGLDHSLLLAFLVEDVVILVYL